MAALAVAGRPCTDGIELLEKPLRLRRFWKRFAVDLVADTFASLWPRQLATMMGACGDAVLAVVVVLMVLLVLAAVSMEEHNEWVEDDADDDVEDDADADDDDTAGRAAAGDDGLFSATAASAVDDVVSGIPSPATLLCAVRSSSLSSLPAPATFAIETDGKAVGLAGETPEKLVELLLLLMLLLMPLAMLLLLHNNGGAVVTVSIADDGNGLDAAATTSPLLPLSHRFNSLALIDASTESVRVVNFSEPQRCDSVGELTTKSTVSVPPPLWP